jgi:hypothetical protein
VSNPYTSTNIIASLRRRGQLASSPQQLDTDDFLAFLTEECQTYMTALLMSVREEHLLTTLDTTGTGGVVQIPSRAVGGKLKQVLVNNGSGYAPLVRVEPERVDASSAGGSPSGYVLQGNHLLLTPTPTGSTSVRLTYFRRPSRVVDDTASVGLVTALNRTTGVITVSSLPGAFSGAVAVDFVSGTPGFDSLGDDVSGTGDTTANTVTVAPSSLPARLSVGDYVCLAGETPIPQLPVELHPLLAQRVVVKCLEALGDSKVAVAEAQCEKQRLQALTLLSPRVEGAARVVINYSGPGWRGRR